MSSPALKVRERLPRFAEDAVARARLTVVPRRRTAPARMPFVTMVSLLLLGGVVGLLCFNTQMQQASFAATSLEARASNLAAREQILHEELRALRSPQSLATRAQQAGMVVPETACTVQLGTGQLAAGQGCAPASAANTPRLQARPPAKPKVLNPDPVIITVAGSAPDAQTDGAAGAQTDGAAGAQTDGAAASGESGTGNRGAANRPRRR